MTRLGGACTPGKYSAWAPETGSKSCRAWAAPRGTHTGEWFLPLSHGESAHVQNFRNFSSGPGSLG